MRQKYCGNSNTEIKRVLNAQIYKFFKIERLCQKLKFNRAPGRKKEKNKLRITSIKMQRGRTQQKPTQLYQED